MTIRNKLTLLFTSLIAVILLSLDIYIYYLSELYTNREFDTRVEERILLAGQLFLEADEISSRVSNRLRKQFQQTLPEEVIRIYDRKDSIIYQHEMGAYDFTPAVLRQVREEHTLNLTD